MIYLQLAFEFFKTGLFAVGGGLATLPFLYDMSAETHWFTSQDILNLVAVSESTPGAIGINMATYVGYLTAGPLGGIWATLALAAPSVIIISLIAKALNKFKDSQIVQGVFQGLRPASIGLITSAGLGVAQMAFLDLSAFNGQLSSLAVVVNWRGILLAVLLYIGIRKFKKHPILYIAIAAAIGIIFQF